MDETELERMVVRLIGDNEKYLAMLEESAAATKEVTGQLTKDAKSGFTAWTVAAGQLISNFVMEGISKLKQLAQAAIGGFAEAEQGELFLRAALEANGRQVESTLEDYKKFATQLQSLIPLEDDATLRMFRYAESMGLTGDAAKEAIKNAVALSKISPYGGSAEGMMRFGVMAAQGQYDALRRMIPALRGIKDESKLAEAAQKAMATGMKMAQSELGTYNGLIAMLKIEWGSALEEMGAIVVPVLKNMVGDLRIGIAKFQEMVPCIQAVGRSIIDYVGKAWEWLRQISAKTIFEIEFMFRNIIPILQLVWTSAALSMVRFANQIIHFFGTVIPSLLVWFANNWQDVFFTMISYAWNMLKNLGQSIKNLFEAIWAWVKGEDVDWDAVWIDITKGAVNAIKAAPNIPDRVVGELEKQLQKDVDRLAATLADAHKKFMDERMKLFNEEAPPVLGNVEKGLDMALKNVKKAVAEIKKSLKFDAADFASAEALFRLQEWKADWGVGDGGGGKGKMGAANQQLRIDGQDKPLEDIGEGIDELVSLTRKQLEQGSMGVVEIAGIA